MAPQWLQALAWASLAVGVVSALLLVYDIVVRGYRQQMPIMDWVWPITALYFGLRAPRGADDLSGGERPSPPDLSQQGR